MADPLSQIVELLRPRAVFTKGISGSGRWAVRYGDFGHPSFAVVVEGSCRLAVDGEQPLVLETGDLVLLPRTPGFTIGGFEPVTPVRIDPHAAAADGDTEVRHGSLDGRPDVRLLGGYFLFGGDEQSLLVPLLPRQVHVRGIPRLSMLVALLVEEESEARSGGALVRSRLVEILLIEALRLNETEDAPPGLLRGLADPRLRHAIRRMHEDPGRAWTMAELAREAALSRSAFFQHFLRHVGAPPMEYLLAWRMALAKDLLSQNVEIAAVAERVGYGSASTFSTAFSRHVGAPPGRYARAAAASATAAPGNVVSSARQPAHRAGRQRERR